MFIYCANSNTSSSQVNCYKKKNCLLMHASDAPPMLSWTPFWIRQWKFVRTLITMRRSFWTGWVLRLRNSQTSVSAKRLLHYHGIGKLQLLRIDFFEHSLWKFTLFVTMPRSIRNIWVTHPLYPVSLKFRTACKRIEIFLFFISNTAYCKYSRALYNL